MEGENNRLIKISSIHIQEMKNVRDGLIEFFKLKDYKKSFELNEGNLLGVYGPNGTGKTTVIETSRILKLLLTGDQADHSESFPIDLMEYMNKESRKATNTFTFVHEEGSQKFIYEYRFGFAVDEIGGKEAPVLCTEELWYSQYDNENQKWSTKKKLFSYDRKNQKLVIGTAKGTARLNPLAIERLLAFAYVKPTSSILFLTDSDKVLAQLVHDDDVKLLIQIRDALRDFAWDALFIMGNGSIGEVSGHILLINSQINDGRKKLRGRFPIVYREENQRKTSIPTWYYPYVEKVFGQISIIMNVIIPGFRLEASNPETIVERDGTELTLFDVICRRKEHTLQLKYESEGIKRILSVLSSLIFYCNNQFSCVMIDEMDAGVYEHLLGELLVALEDMGRGQLLFTAHNLRPLERLQKKHLVFTTMDPFKRFIRFHGIKETNNLRDIYLREVLLGINDKTPLNTPVKASKLRGALLKVGRKE